MREDMTKLRRSIAEGAEDSENEAVREMADQYEVVQEELDRVKAECLQLRAVLANVQLSGEHDQVFIFILLSSQSDNIALQHCWKQCRSDKVDISDSSAATFSQTVILKTRNDQFFIQGESPIKRQC